MTNHGRTRVMFIVPQLGVGGAERHITTLLPSLDPTRFESSLICIGEEGALFSELVEAGIEAHALRLPGKSNAMKAFRQLVARMRSAKPDVVFVWGYSSEILGRIAAIAAGVRVKILWLHNSRNIHPRSGVRDVVERILVHATDRYFGVAEAQRPFMVDTLGYPPRKIRIIHNGVDPVPYEGPGDRGVLPELGIIDDSPVVAIIAALRPEKDHETFLRAAREVLESVPNAKFLLVGDGELRSQLESLTAQLDIASSVRFVGWRRDIARILRAVDVVVLCSRTECFPISILEAMAASRPVVCTAVGGIPEMVEDGVTGYLVPPGGVSQLAERISDVLMDPYAARRMGIAGRNRIESEFTLDGSIRAAERAIEEAIQSGA